MSRQKKKDKIKNAKNSFSSHGNLCGKWIRYVRLGFYDKNHPKISQDTLIARLETRGLYMTRSSLSRIETGIRILTDIEIIYFAEALHVPIYFLFEGPSKTLPTIEELSSYVADCSEYDADNNN